MKNKKNITSFNTSNDINKKVTALIVYEPKNSDIIVYESKNSELIVYDESKDILNSLNLENNHNLALFLSLCGPFLDISLFIHGLDRDLLLGLKNISGIYCWYNFKNGKYYIGSAKDLYERLRRYYKPSELNKNNMVISRALLKYGHKDFYIIILHTFPKSWIYNNNFLLNKEQFYIDYLKPDYNVAVNTLNSYGIKRSEEFKLKVSNSLIGNTNALGLVHTDKSKNQMSESHMNREFTDEHKANLSKSNIGNTNSSKAVILLDKDKKVVKTFNSRKECELYLNTNHSTLNRYIKSGSLYNNTYYIVSQIAVKNYTYSLYSLDMTFIISFPSLNSMGNYLNVSSETIKRYSVSGKILLSKYYVKSNEVI